MLKRFRSLKTWLFPALFALLAMSPAHAAPAPGGPKDFADYSNPQNLPDEEIGIINLSDQEVTPKLRDCLKKHLLGECLKKQLGGQPLKPQTPPQNLGGEIDQDTSKIWSEFLFSAITPNQSVFNTHGVGFYYGVQIGGDRIDMDQVAMDPNKLATEQKLGTNDVWVNHDFEILPQMGYGLGPLSANSSGPAKQQYFNGLFTFNNVMRITKRHPMDQLYNDNFWGYTRQDVKMIEQDFPMYLGISSELDGQGMLPGEGVEFERYGSIGLGIGPTLSFIATPVSFTTLQAGIFGSAGLMVNLVRGHFRTVMEVQEDGTLHLALEHIKEETVDLQAQIDAGVSLPVIGSYILNLLKFEWGTSHTSETVLDMVLDPKYPQARKALYHAYLGFFGTAQALAAQADTNYQGVRSVDHADMNEVNHHLDFSTPFYSRGSSIAQDTVVSQPDDGDGDNDATEPGPHPSLAPVETTTVDSMDQHRDTLESKKDLQIYIDTDDTNPDPDTDRSLSVKFKFQTKNARPGELREFLDLGRVLAPADKQPEIAGWLETLETVRPRKKRGPLQAFFFLNFDPSTIASLLDVPDADKKGDLIVNWARALGLPHPESWGKMTEKQQNQAARHVRGLKHHLQRFRQFVKAVENALNRTDPVSQARAFVKALRGKSYDLYPIASLAIPTDHSHILALERITLGKGANAKSFEFSSIGANYVFPKKTLY